MNQRNKKIEQITGSAREASKTLARVNTTAKNACLMAMAELLEDNKQKLVAANKKDMEAAERDGIAESLVNRLLFDEAKIDSRIRSLAKIARLPDPVGQVKDMQRTENGLLVGRMQVPLGVLLMIYEARPHVTVNAGAFALKSGNAIICKGGSEASNCNTLLNELWRKALETAGLPPKAVQVLQLSHQQVDELLNRPQEIDLVIPRGGKKLIETVASQSKIPVIKHYEGVCSVYIGREADREKALNIALDSKLLMPAVCNAAETVLVDSSMEEWVPELVSELTQNGIEVRGCEKTCALSSEAVPASEDDWGTEYLDKIYSFRIVNGIEEAMEHIEVYGSAHTDVIVTENYSDAQRFIEQVDSSVVMANASTMFCDGETLGMGAEIGISTDRFHARGPMGLPELTIYKHVIWGGGQIYGE